MSVLAFAGAELGATAELTSPTGIAIDATVVHGGKYSFRVSVGGAGTLVFAEHTTPIYFRGYYRYPAGLVSGTRILEWRDGAGTALVALEQRADNLLLQIVGSPGVGYGATPVVPDVWHLIEVLLNQATGYAEVRMNCRQEIVATLTIPSAMAQIALMSTSGNVYWDDIHVTEDGWPGPGFVIARQGRPGTPTYDTFTKTGGTIDQCWADTPSAIATNAVSSAPSQNQTMFVEALSQVPIAGKYGAQAIAALDTVYGAAIYANGHRVGGGPDHYIIRASAGAITRNGPHNFTSLDTYRTTGIFAATLAQLDAMEIGGARGDITTALSNLLINDMWLVVSYAKAPVPMRHFTGLETGSLAEVGSPVGMTIDTTQVRSGVYALKGVGPGALFAMHLDAIEAPTIWLRGYVYFSALPAVGDALLSVRDASGLIVSANIRASGQGRLTVGATSINGGTFVPGVWNYVELFKRASVLPGDGYAAMWVNETLISVAMDTGGVTVQALGEVRSQPFPYWFDDLALSETGRLGPGRVLARQGLPGAAAANNGWTETGGTIDVVWSNTPSNPATYSQATTVFNNQTMTVDPKANGGVSLAPTDTILACRVVAMARYDTGVYGGPTSLRIRLPRPELSLPTLVKDTPVVLTSATARLVFGEVFAAVLGHLNAMQIGGAQGASGPSFMRIDDIWLMIAYAELQILDLPLPSVPAPVAIVEIEL